MYISYIHARSSSDLSVEDGASAFETKRLLDGTGGSPKRKLVVNNEARAMFVDHLKALEDVGWLGEFCPSR